jgi:hypothetical protein
MHVEGAAVPGAPILPEFLKAHVYIPPHLVAELPACRQSIATIVQTFLEDIGVPTVEQWAASAHAKGWSLSSSGAVVTPSTTYPYLIPPPTAPASAHYVFRGRPYGSLAAVVPGSSESATARTMLPLPQSSDEDFPEQPDPFQLALINATEKIAYLDEQLALAAQKEEEYLAEITGLRNELTAVFSKLRKRETTIANYSQRLEGIPSGQRSPSPSSSQCDSPAAAPQVLHFFPKSPSPSKNFPKIKVSRFPRPYPFDSEPPALDLSPTHQSSLTPHRAPKTKKDKSSTDLEVGGLGPAAVAFLSDHNLTQISAMVGLLVEHNAPTMWGLRLASFSLTDAERQGLLEALTTDWLSQ